MKIIFDSEKQKEDMMAVLTGEKTPCPGNVGFKETCGRIGIDCADCWESVLDIEVRHDGD